jgi:hypothetical protein
MWAGDRLGSDVVPSEIGVTLSGFNQESFEQLAGPASDRLAAERPKNEDD